MTASDRSAGGENGIPADLAPGLDLFAAAWLEKFCEIGGSVHMGPDGKALFGWAEYSCSRFYSEPSAELSEADQRREHAFRGADYNGRIRALMDLLETLPQGAEAVKAHMRLHGMRHYIGPVGPRPPAN
ncbi:hypothetical protein [Sphingopyxis sp. 550A]